MTEDRLPLAELLAKAADGDFLRSVAEAVVQLLMETDVAPPTMLQLSSGKRWCDVPLYSHGMAKVVRSAC